MGNRISIPVFPGTLAERLRAGGAGIPAFFTKTGFGTMVEQGGYPIRYKSASNDEMLSAAKETRTFDGANYVMERALTGDWALIKGWKADTMGNVTFRVGGRWGM